MLLVDTELYLKFTPKTFLLSQWSWTCIILYGAPLVKIWIGIPILNCFYDQKNGCPALFTLQVVGQGPGAGLDTDLCSLGA